MKLIFCSNCHQVVSLLSKKTVTCSCKKVGGKFLSDNLTAVINKEAIVVGIDNNSFSNAVKGYFALKNTYPTRVDTFFTGWIPSIPGEVIVVDTITDVRKYPFKTKIKLTISTMPVPIPLKGII